MLTRCFFLKLWFKSGRLHILGEYACLLITESQAQARKRGIPSLLLCSLILRTSIFFLNFIVPVLWPRLEVLHVLPATHDFHARLHQIPQVPQLLGSNAHGQKSTALRDISELNSATMSHSTFLPMDKITPQSPTQECSPRTTALPSTTPGIIQRLQ